MILVWEVEGRCGSAEGGGGEPCGRWKETGINMHLCISSRLGEWGQEYINKSINASPMAHTARGGVHPPHC